MYALFEIDKSPTTMYERSWFIALLFGFMKSLIYLTIEKQVPTEQADVGSGDKWLGASSVL